MSITPIKKYFIVLTLIISVSQVFGQDKLKTSNSSLSSTYLDYAPTPYKNGILYCSDKKDDLFLTYKDQEERNLTNLYYSELDGEKWKHPHKLDRSLQPHFHQGPADLNSDESLLAVTINTDLQFPDRKSKEHNYTLGIYFSKFNGELWSEYEPFPYNSKDYNIAHPLFYNDTTLIFVSDKTEDNLGGSDLFISHYINGEWSVPKNMGPNINSANDEKFPTSNKLGILYFSSNRPKTRNYDIFYSYRDLKNQWTNAIKYDEINTAYDDFSLIEIKNDSTGHKGIFVSKGKLNDDIFEFVVNYPAFADCDPNQPNDYCFTFTEEGAVNIDSMPYVYQWDFGDGQTALGITARHCFITHGTYEVKLNVVDTVTDEVFMNQASYEVEIEQIDYPFIQSLDTVIDGRSIPLSGIESQVMSFEINNYYWQIGDNTIKAPKIDYMFPDTGIYPVILAVTGPKDQSGNYEKKCVLKDIVVTKDSILVQNHQQRVQKGKTRDSLQLLSPKKDVNFNIDPNQSLTDAQKANEDGTSLITNNNLESTLSPEQQQIRDSLMLLKQMKEAEFGIQTDPTLIDQTKNNPDDTNLANKKVNEQTKTTETESSEQSGNPEKETSSTKSDVVINNTIKIEDLVKLESIESLNLKPNTTIIFSNGFFDFDSFKIKSKLEDKLGHLVEFLKNRKNLGIMIEGHTDSQGDEKYNYNLSINRAIAVKKHLVSKGISKSRIQVSGKGESEPIKANSTEDGRKFNRRIEVKLVK